MAAPNTNIPAAGASATAAMPVLVPTVGPTVAKPASHVEKPQQFNGEDFNRWQQKMVFYLTTLNLAHILKEECPVTPDEDITVET